MAITDLNGGVETIKFLDGIDTMLVMFGNFAHKQDVGSFSKLLPSIESYLRTLVVNQAVNVNAINNTVNFSDVQGLLFSNFIKILNAFPAASISLTFFDDNFVLVSKQEFIALIERITGEVIQEVEERIINEPIDEKLRQSVGEWVGEKYGFLDVFGLRTLFVRYILGIILRRASQSEV